MDGSQPQSCSARSPRPSLGTYILAGLVGACLAYLVIGLFTPAPTLALPQDGRPACCAGGIMAVPAQLDSDAYGLYLIDLKNQTILLYGYGGPWSRGLRLMSARCFQYDRQLLDFNSGAPSPQDVKQLIDAGLKSPALPKEAQDSVIEDVTEPESVPMK